MLHYILQLQKDLIQVDDGSKFEIKLGKFFKVNSRQKAQISACNPARKWKLSSKLEVLFIRLQNDFVAKCLLDLSFSTSKVPYRIWESQDYKLLSSCARTNQSRSQESSGVEKLRKLNFWKKLRKTFRLLLIRLQKRLRSLKSASLYSPTPEGPYTNWWQ